MVRESEGAGEEREYVNNNSTKGVRLDLKGGLVKKLKCPVCNKPLTQTEYDKALGLWKDKQEHIQHLEEEQKRLKDLEKRNIKKLDDERKKLRKKEQQYKKQAGEFKKEQARLRKETRRLLADQEKRSAEQLKGQRLQLEKTFSNKMKTEVKRGIAKGVEQQRKDIKKQAEELKKSKSKMTQLENSLKLSAKKYEQANEEIKKLKIQIEKGITPQIEGLLEEGILLAKLKELFPQDKFEHPGKGGDIIHFVMTQGKEVGKIVYECKKVKNFDKKHIEQAKQARNLRHADFAVLVTNAFPSKKQYYFVDKTVFVISPVSLEPITYTLRESLIKMALLKMSNEAKQKAVQKVYDYLSGSEYNNKMNDIAMHLMDLGKDLKSEIVTHKRTWEKRYHIYTGLFNDIGVIDTQLKELVHNRLELKQKFLLEPKKVYVQIEELQKHS
jgi:hypothetical protein